MRLGALRLLCCLLGLGAPASIVAPAVEAAVENATADHAVILLYHHVSDSTPPSTSVTPVQFTEHLDFIERSGFVVLPLLSLLDALQRGEAVPDNAVAITFDDAYRSVYEEAFPRLRDRGMPFSVFVADGPVDAGFRDYMSWPQLKELVEAGVTIGGHSVDHAHLVRRPEGVTRRDWARQVRAQIEQNQQRLQEVLAVEVAAFAYPYGEHSPALEALLDELGLFGLAQQSGAVGVITPKTAIPRFPMMRGMGSIERLTTALKSRPLPISRVDAGALIRQAGGRADTWSFELADGPYREDALACYSAKGEALTLRRRGARVQVALPPLAPGRNKINCTAPSSTGGGEFFWHSQQWLATDKDGAWPEE